MPADYPDIQGRDIARCDPYRPHLLGLHGHSGAGKDAAADALVELGWTRVRFSDAIMAVARGLGWDGDRTGDGRRFLQDLGAVVRDHIHPEAWIMAVERAIDAAPGPVVITGIRKPNEVTMVRRRGGLLARVVRPGFGSVNDHAIEAEIDSLPYDRLLVNDGGVRRLHARTVALVSSRIPA